MKAQLTLVAALAAAISQSAPGTFTYDQEVNSGRSDGKISYRLELQDRNVAKMTVSLSGRIENDRETMRDFGHIVNEALNNRNKVVLTGSYRQSKSNIGITFDQLSKGDRNDHRVRMTMSGTLRDDVLSLTAGDRYEFGDRVRFRFQKSGGGGGVTTKDVLAGLAVLATAAIIANNTKSSDNKNETPEWVDDWRSDEDVEGISRASLEYDLILRDDKTVVLETRQRGDFRPDRVLINKYGDVLNYLEDGETVRHEGKWSERNGEVTISLETLKYGRRDETRLRSTFKGRIQRGRFVFSTFDERLYGNKPRMEFRK